MSKVIKCKMIDAFNKFGRTTGDYTYQEFIDEIEDCPSYDFYLHIPEVTSGVTSLPAISYDTKANFTTGFNNLKTLVDDIYVKGGLIFREETAFPFNFEMCNYDTSYCLFGASNRWICNHIYYFPTINLYMTFDFWHNSANSGIMVYFIYNNTITRTKLTSGTTTRFGALARLGTDWKFITHTVSATTYSVESVVIDSAGQAILDLLLDLPDAVDPGYSDTITDVDGSLTLTIAPQSLIDDDWTDLPTFDYKVPLCNVSATTSMNYPSGDKEWTTDNPVISEYISNYPSIINEIYDRNAYTQGTIQPVWLRNSILEGRIAIGNNYIEISDNGAINYLQPSYSTTGNGLTPVLREWRIGNMYMCGGIDYSWQTGGSVGKAWLNNITIYPSHYNNKLFWLNSLAVSLINITPAPSSRKLTVTTDVYPDDSGTLSGAGEYSLNDTFTLRAVPDDDYYFVKFELYDATLGKWVDMSEGNPYTKTVTQTMLGQTLNVRAVFKSQESPYDPGGHSGEGGGDGSFDDTSDTIDDDHSTDTAWETNFISAFKLIEDEIHEDISDFSEYLYGSTLKGQLKQFIDDVGGIGRSAEDYIIKFMKIPVDIPPTALSARKGVNLGWYTSTLQWQQILTTMLSIDMGSLEIEPYWNNALDYKSTIQIYLPYIGYEDLDASAVMNKTISLTYNISTLTGECVAQIWVNGSVMYQFNGNMAYEIPISQDNVANTIQQGINIGTNIATAKGLGSTIVSGKDALLASANKSEQLFDDLQNAASNIGGNVSRGGTLAGQLGKLTVQTPYIIINRPRLSMPENYAHYHGFPSNITSVLRNLSGYTEVSSIHLEGIPCTASELEEIDNLLHTGVIL